MGSISCQSHCAPLTFPVPERIPFSPFRLWHFVPGCYTTSSPHLGFITHADLSCHPPGEVPPSRSPIPHTRPSLSPTTQKPSLPLLGTDTMPDGCLISSRLQDPAWGHPTIQVPHLPTQTLTSCSSQHYHLMTPMLTTLLTPLWLQCPALGLPRLSQPYTWTAALLSLTYWLSDWIILVEREDKEKEVEKQKMNNRRLDFLCLHLCLILCYMYESPIQNKLFFNNYNYETLKARGRVVWMN